MREEEWRWRTNDNLEIHSKAWLPDGQPKGVICVVHGVGEHLGRYQTDGEIMARAGYIQAAYDQRGFGLSEGRRGHTPSYDAYFDDIELFLSQASGRYSGLPVFLYGMSMGAMLVLAFTPVRKPAVQGVIAAAPGLKTALEKQKVKVLLAKILGKALPKLALDSGLDPQELCRDQQVIDDYVNDPLVHHRVTTSWGKSMLEVIDLAYKNAPAFPLPLLLMHGTADQIAYLSGSTLYHELAPKDKVTFKLWNGFKHELRTDPEKAEVFRFMIGWMDQHV